MRPVPPSPINAGEPLGSSSDTEVVYRFLPPAASESRNSNVKALMRVSRCNRLPSSLENLPFLGAIASPARGSTRSATPVRYSHLAIQSPEKSSTWEPPRMRDAAQRENRTADGLRQRGLAVRSVGNRARAIPGDSDFWSVFKNGNPPTLSGSVLLRPLDGTPHKPSRLGAECRPRHR